MKLICCVVFFVVCVKKLVLKMLFILTDRIVDANFGRNEFIFGKDKLVEPLDQRIDVSQRQVWDYQN
jgi:hypothetical protein